MAEKYIKLEDACSLILELSGGFEWLEIGTDLLIEKLKAIPATDVVERPRWISVEERLPEKHHWCLVVGENLYDMDFINSRGVWTMHDKPYSPIAYWMPLPEPPEEATT